MKPETRLRAIDCAPPHSLAAPVPDDNGLRPGEVAPFPNYVFAGRDAFGNPIFAPPPPADGKPRRCE